MKDLMIDFLRVFIFVTLYFVIAPICIFLLAIAVMYVFGWAFAIAPILGLIAGIAEVSLILIGFKTYFLYKSIR